ncbi:hypothetical protein NEFER03_1667 [Nematocida sp. LUAm3]|nr:hypothetical protein NEFER03_1667 [Nematocida sp. LUAm3]KAI5175616.1 hypothetical protein NEFER02_1503 [Nematocida sp. LUAm2]KAI5178522.1 hypothetical protein NEFER01_1658 [Nematocida sp. LUAm1]
MESNTTRESPEQQEFQDVYTQEYRSQGSLKYTGSQLISSDYEKDSYPAKSSISYEYITHVEAFSTRIVVFSIPMSHFRR